MKPGHTGTTRLLKAIYYSYKGLLAAFRHEEAFRLDMLLAAVLIPLAFWLHVNPVERMLMILVVVLVLVVELLNSAVEAAVDRIGEEHHELAGRAKDMGSAAVLVSLGLVAFVWATILLTP